MIINSWPKSQVKKILSSRLGQINQALIDQSYNLAGGNPDLTKAIASFLIENQPLSEMSKFAPVNSRVQNIISNITSLGLPVEPYIKIGHYSLPLPPIVPIQASSIDQLLTKNESQIYQAFTNSPSVLLTKDDLAKILWPKDWTEKYSEWSIYKTINNLNKKLISANLPVHIKVNRSRGYQLVSSS